MSDDEFRARSKGKTLTEVRQMFPESIISRLIIETFELELKEENPTVVISPEVQYVEDTV